MSTNLSLYKINDVIDSGFIRFPLALLANPKYKSMSLEAKVVYSLLLNRLTLFQRHGWLNDKNEVYLIFTREETAETLGITYKKAIAAFKELIAHSLIVEQRRGRGLPNIIFIVKAELSESAAKEFGGQFDMTESEAEQEFSEARHAQNQTCQNGTSRYAETAVLDVPESQFKTCQNSSSRYAAGESLYSKTEKRKTDSSQINVSQSVLPAEDEKTLAEIFDRCEFDIWEDESVELMFKSAIERLYYSEKVRIGSAVLPREKVRSYLNLLDGEIIRSTYDALRLNRDRVKNTTGYLMSALFNNICEKDACLLINLPPEYLDRGG